MNKTMSTSSLAMPYHRFVDLQKQLANVEAIDYFFAKQFAEILLQPEHGGDRNRNTTEFDTYLTEYTTVLFHLLVALSVSLREGHSCLPLSAIANQRFGYSCDSVGIISHQGFHFPNLEQLNNMLTALSLNHCLVDGVDLAENHTGSFQNEENQQQQQGIIYHHEKLYLRRYFLFEQQVIGFIKSHHHNDAKLLNNKKESMNPPASIDDFTAAKIVNCLNSLFPETIIESTAEKQGEQSNNIDWQKVAVANALNKSFSIIAGGPGTGKTYTVTKLLAAIVMLKTRQSVNISLVAPTGKAAQRLSESISQAKFGFKSLLSQDVLDKIPTETKTIHRLLGVIPNSPNFKHDQLNKLNIDVLLIDEVSMVDLPLMARIFRALPEHCQVILLGDAQQLPSVAAGSVLSDLTPFEQAQYSVENSLFLKKMTGIKHLPVSRNKPVDHLTYLTQSRRFDGKGGIGVLSKLVIAGDNEQSWQLLQDAKEGNIPQLTFIEQSNDITHDGKWFKTLVEQYYRPLTKANSIEQAFHLLSKFRFLSATRQGETGVEAINHGVESLLFPHLFANAFINNQINNHSNVTNKLYHTKPIMITENDYSLGLYNGDIGILWQNDNGHLMAIFEQEKGEFKHILPSRLPQFETVYAMTIHKTQGSEFNHVAMVLPTNIENQLLTRELLYTGITRAKEHITLHAKKPVWFQGVESKVARHSGIELNTCV